MSRLRTRFRCCFEACSCSRRMGTPVVETLQTITSHSRPPLHGLSSSRALLHLRALAAPCRCY
eukprot:15445524-Alexandrium_andersonii.AAC.1